MDGSIMADPPPSNPTGDFDGFPIPPLDSSFFSQHADKKGNLNDDFMLDDLDFDLNIDDIFLHPSDADPLLNPNFLPHFAGSDSGHLESNCFDDSSSFFKAQDWVSDPNPGQVDPNLFGQPGSQLLDNSSRVFKSTSKDWVSGPPDFVDSDSGQPGSQLMANFAGDQAAGGMDTSSMELHQNSGSSGVLNTNISGDISGYLSVPSPESNGSNHDGYQESMGNDNKGWSEARVLNCNSPESQGSGNCGSNFSEGLNYPSDSNKSVHSSPNLRNNSVKIEGVNANNVSKCSSLLKRKKGSEDSNNVSKHQKSMINVASGDNVDNDEEDEKRKARLIRNRESAQLSRQRKKHYVEELEDKVKIMHSTIQDLNAKISYIMAENATLRTQLGGTGVPPQVQPPPQGMYPPPHMMYPWMPYAPPYMVKPQGSQVPLVPIPKLRPQAAEPAPKSSKKVEKKKSEVKTKKVASISFLGLLFFMLLFGGLVPMLNVRYGGTREPFMTGDSYGSGFYEKHHGRVLAVDGPVNGTGYSGKYGGKDYSSHCGRRGHGGNDQPNSSKAADEFARTGNGSDLLAASLYVPRNDKLVKIDGNLIIHSVLASEKAMASHESADKNRETGLAVPGDLAPAIPGRHPHLYRSPAVGQRALGNGEKENAKSAMQQWFLEGVAGPFLSSGMCTEVFQFDVSSAIVPATASRNLSMEENQNATRLNKEVRNRRILNGPSVSLTRPTHNISEEQTGKQENLSGNKSVSSMVVSVLVDPREAGDGDGDGMMGPKSLSRIFVVLLIDSAKYVTYSCMLPFKGSVPLVTT